MEAGIGQQRRAAPRTAGGLGPLRGVCVGAAWAGDAHPPSEAREPVVKSCQLRAAARMIPAGTFTVGLRSHAISILFARNEYVWYKRRISLAISSTGRLGAEMVHPLRQELTPPTQYNLIRAGPSAAIWRTIPRQLLPAGGGRIVRRKSSTQASYCGLFRK